MHVDDCGPAAGNVAPVEKLRMNLHTVAGADGDWFRGVQSGKRYRLETYDK